MKRRRLPAGLAAGIWFKGLYIKRFSLMHSPDIGIDFSMAIYEIKHCMNRGWSRKFERGVLEKYLTIYHINRSAKIWLQKGGSWPPGSICHCWKIQSMYILGHFHNYNFEGSGFAQTLGSYWKSLNFISTIQRYWKLLKNVLVSLLLKAHKNRWIVWSAGNRFRCTTDLMHNQSIF